MAWWTKLVDLKLNKLVDSIGSNIDRFVTTKEEKEQLKHAILKSTQEFQLEFLKDRQDARDMYQTDSWLQKIYALVFLIFYLFLTGIMMYMVYLIALNSFDLPEWGITFIATIWGGMSTKVGTITDFLFGSSQGSRTKDTVNILKSKNNE